MPGKMSGRMGVTVSLVHPHGPIRFQRGFAFLVEDALALSTRQQADDDEGQENEKNAEYDRLAPQQQQVLREDHAAHAALSRASAPLSCRCCM